MIIIFSRTIKDLIQKRALYTSNRVIFGIQSQSIFDFCVWLSGWTGFDLSEDFICGSFTL